MLTLSEYLSIAEKIVNKYSPYLSKDEDAISYVATYIMIADDKYSGQGTREGWRSINGRFGLKNYVSRELKKTKTPGYSIYSEENKNIFNIRDDALSAEDKMTVDDILKIVDEIGERQSYCVRKYFLDGNTLEEIGKELGITRSAVSSIIKNTIKKVKKKFVES